VRNVAVPMKRLTMRCGPITPQRFALLDGID